MITVFTGPLGKWGGDRSVKNICQTLMRVGFELNDLMRGPVMGPYEGALRPIEGGSVPIDALMKRDTGPPIVVVPQRVI